MKITSAGSISTSVSPWPPCDIVTASEPAAIATQQALLHRTFRAKPDYAHIAVLIVDETRETYRERYDAFRERFCSYETGHAAEHVVKEFFEKGGAR